VKKILIVEDDPHIASSLEIRFRAGGYATMVASDAVQGTRLAVQGKPDLAILDVSLPAGSGLTVAELFNKIPETQGLPIIFITAHKEPQIRDKIVDLNVAGFFEKPYDIEEVLAAVQSTLEDRAASAGQLTPAPNKKEPWTKTRTAKILIVEDDSKIAMALALRLKAAGYETMLAFDALLGLTTALRIPPDLVLLDISMPAGNGLELAKKLQKLLPEPPPIIFLTASKQPALRQKAQDLGAAAYFEKPYEAEELMAAIQKALQNGHPPTHDHHQERQ